MERQSAIIVVSANSKNPMEMKEITLKRHQQEVIDWTDPKFKDLNPERFGLFFAPRVGKTFVLLALCEKYNVSALIIVPKGIKTQWQDYVKGTGHCVVTKEEFRRDYKTLEKFEAFIFDEAHHASNPKSQLTKACFYYMKKYNPKYRWLATGTPYRSSPMNIFGLGKLLGRDWDYWKFYNQFYMMIPMGGRTVPVLKKGTEAKLEAYVRSIGITLLLEDVEEIETLPSVPERIDFELTHAQEEAIKGIEDATAIARFTKIHAIEQGYVPGDEYVDAIDLESKKIDWVIQRVNRTERIAIVCRFTHQIEFFEKYFSPDPRGFYCCPNHCDTGGYESCCACGGWETGEEERECSESFPNRKVLVINGQAKRTASEIAEEARGLDNVVVILQAACCEGFDLSTMDDMIFASMSFSHSDHTQMKDRIVNMNKPKVNRYWYLIGGTVDASVYANVMNKQDFHYQIFAKQIV